MRIEPGRRRAARLIVGLAVAGSIGTLASRYTAEARPAVQARRAKAVRPKAVRAPQQLPDGKQIFSRTCAACHQASGEGIEGKYPPLAGSEWVTGDDAKLVRIVLLGLTGPVDVAGESYSGAMPGWGGVLKDPELAAVMSYVRGAWGNKAAPVTSAQVAAVRAATASRKTPWTMAELAQVIRPVEKK
jgi:mono/diheme cytochrome c family protein